MYSTLHATGFFMVMILGAYLPWRWAVAIPAFVAFPAFFGISRIYESPEWLHKKGYVQLSTQSTQYYQRELEEEEEDAKSLDMNMPKEVVMIEKEHCMFGLAKKMCISINRIVWENPRVPQHFIYLIVLHVCIGWGGFSILSFYAVGVFQKTGSPLSPVQTAWIVSITKIVCSLISFYVLVKFQRLVLFLFG